MSSLTVSTEIATFGTVSYVGNFPELQVKGNIISNGSDPFVLVGCNVRGQAYDPITDGKYDDWFAYRYQDAANIESYGFNTIRLLVYWECLEISNGSAHFFYNDTYVEQIRETVNAYNEKGIYVILNLHEHGGVNTLGNFVPTNGNDADFADAFYSDRSTEKKGDWRVLM